MQHKTAPVPTHCITAILLELLELRAFGLYLRTTTAEDPAGELLQA